MSGSDSDSPPQSPELRERIRAEEFDHNSSKEEINEKDPMSEKESDHEDEETSEPEIVLENEREPKVTVYRAIQRPSFISRQLRTINNFFVDLFEFILLFLTTLFNPMADVNTQVQEHNQRKAAREGRYFSNSNSGKKQSSPFPGCGPSS